MTLLTSKSHLGFLQSDHNLEGKICSLGKRQVLFNIKMLSLGTLQSAVHDTLLKDIMSDSAYFVYNISSTLKFSTFSG